MKREILLFCVASFLGLLLIGLAGSHHKDKKVDAGMLQGIDCEVALSQAKTCQASDLKTCLPDSSIKVSGSNTMSKEEALKIAESVCRKERWEQFWQDIRVEDEDSCWKIWTPRLGSNISIRIDKRTGKVIEKFLTGP